MNYNGTMQDPTPGFHETLLGALAATVRFVHELTRYGTRNRSMKKLILVASGKCFVGAFCGYIAYLLCVATEVDQKWMGPVAGSMGYAGGDYLMGRLDALLQRLFPARNNDDQ